MMNYLQKKKQALLNYVQSGGRLPSEYQEVEWIENINKSGGNNNNAYILTNFTPTQNTKLEIEVMTFSNTNNVSLTCDTSNVMAFGLRKENSSSCDGYYFRTKYNGAITDNQKNKIELSQAEYKINDVVVASNLSGGSVPNRDIPIFAYRYGNNFWVSHSRLYSYKLYESGTLERDYVPCYRKADDKVGLYDLVYQEFVTSQNSYDFTKGNDV